MNRITAVLSAFILAVGFAAVTAIPAHATEDTTEVVWLLPETVTELPVGNTPAIWPQTYLPDGVVPCGRFGQADVYPTTEVPALIADGVLVEGEDYAVVVSWRFIDGGVCEVFVPPVDEPTEPEVPVTPVVDAPKVTVLAETGTDAVPYLFGGLGLLLAGAGFMVFRHQGLVLR